MRRKIRGNGKVKNRTLENHKGCGTPSHSCASIVVKRNPLNPIRHPPEAERAGAAEGTRRRQRLQAIQCVVHKVVGPFSGPVMVVLAL
jgi:hypothetical protein